MRNRADIEVEANTCESLFCLNKLELEVLLDIRDLRAEKHSWRVSHQCTHNTLRSRDRQDI